MSVATYARYSFKSEVKDITRETGAFKEGHNETTETAVNMQSYIVLLC